MSNDSITKTFLVATGLCVVCSVIVSVAAVQLRPTQEANKLADKRKNILQAAGLWDVQPGEKTNEAVNRLFAQMTPRVLDMETGDFTDAVDATEFDARQAVRDPSRSVSIDDPQGSGIKRRAKYKVVYLLGDPAAPEGVVLPLHGKGLWSTMYGFLALGSDMNTVRGMGFYEHGETPGLGGEVDNPSWKAQWVGKKVYAEDGDVALQVIKGQVDPGASDAEHKLDGLSGATITSRGVTGTLQYWLGTNGYGPFLSKMRERAPSPETTDTKEVESDEQG